MEPYLVQCSSCKSKIRVRNPNLVGKNVNCPKCASPVLITPPAPPKIHVAASEFPSVDSTALTKEGFAEDALLGLGTVSGQGTETENPEPLGAFSNFDFSEVDQVLLQQSQHAAAEQTMQYYADPDAQTSGANESWQAPERAAPTEQWSSKSAAKSRQMLIVGFLGVSSCLIAALSFYLFLRWYNAGPALADKPPVNQNQGNANKSATDGSNADKLNGSAQDGNAPANDNTQSETREPEANDSKPDAQKPEIVVDSNPSNSTTTPPSNDVAASDSAGTETTAKPNTDGNDSAPPVPVELPPRIKELMKVIGEEPLVISEPPKVLVPDKPKITDLEIQTGARELKMTPVAKLTELASQRRIWSLTMPQKKLHDVVSLWNSTVGLPVAISNISLAASDYDFSQRFDIELKDVNATTGIEQLASAVGLKVENRENRFWLLYAPNPGEDKLPNKIKVDDLVADAVQQQWLKETIELIFPGTSNAISIEAGVLSCKPDQLDRLTWFTMVRMLENWRAHLGLPPQLSGYRKENIDVPFITASKLPQLEATLSQVNSTAKPLAQLINQQCNSVGLSALVDWPALEYLPVRLMGGEAKSILPQTPRISVTFNRPMKNFLKELEFELGMMSLLYDEKTLVLTSRFAYRRMPQVFVIPSEGKSIDGYWDQYFRPLTPIDSAGISSVVMRVTPDGKYLIVKCCWPTLQFE